MDPRLLEYYNRELQFMREMGSEFAREYPRIAARLGLEGLECSDPYVERLLEGFAFLAARVQLKLDARQPEFTQHLLEIVYPDFLAPVPSCAIAEFTPELTEGSLANGVRIPRGSVLRTQLAKGERTACEFRTAQDVMLWPISVREADYLTGSAVPVLPGRGGGTRPRAAVRLRLELAAGMEVDKLPLDDLTFYIRATPAVTNRLYEQVLVDAVASAVRDESGTWIGSSPAAAVAAVGYEDTESLLPSAHATFQGYRLLQEYFAFPERFLFFRVADLKRHLSRVRGNAFELLVMFNRAEPALEHALDPQNFRLYCTPIVNLFPKALDRIHVTDYETEHHVVPDRNRPLDFEIYSIMRVVGAGAVEDTQIDVQPFYAATYRSNLQEGRVYYTVQRRQRLYSSRQLQTGARTSYIGTECYLSISDGGLGRGANLLRQLDVRALCTNRDLPIQLALGKGRTDFTLDGGAPVDSIRAIAGPTAPRASPAFGDTAWKLISHLSLNYLSLAGSSDRRAVELVREMLGLYASTADAVVARQIDGVHDIEFRPCVRRIPIPGPISYGRGLEIDLTLDEASFEGTGVIRLACVLERFFARYASINSFTQTRLRTTARGEVRQWPVRIGTRPAI